MEKLNNFFTLESLLSFQGSVAASLLVPNVLVQLIGDAFRPYRRLVAFGIALALAYLMAILASESHWTKWIIAFFNGFLIFASAVGINEEASRAGSPALSREGFFESWF
jgi:hypothetical protein